MTSAGSMQYQIDAADRITFVGGDWDRFAQDNGGVGLEADKVLGCFLWDFIKDPTTREVYRSLVARARKGHRVRCELRCDGPSIRRFLEMTITARGPEVIEFNTRPLRTEPRETVLLLAAGVPRSEALLRICAWCNYVDVGSDTWLEVEEATSQLRLFEQSAIPAITHGMCPSCYTAMTGVVNSAS